MHVQPFIKMVHFTRLIKAGGRLREFNFRKLKRNEEDIFSVDTVDDRGNRIVFFMQKDVAAAHWSIIAQPLPPWIIENEDTLRDEIQIELQRA